MDREKMTPHEARAAELFLSGAVCAQAVFCAFCDLHGLDCAAMNHPRYIVCAGKVRHSAFTNDGQPACIRIKVPFQFGTADGSVDHSFVCQNGGDHAQKHAHDQQDG